MVTHQTYTQLKLTNMKFLTLFRRVSVNSGKIAEIRQMEIIKIRLGIVTPLSKVVLDLKELLIL